MTLAVALFAGVAMAFATDYGKYYQNLPVKLQQPTAPEISD